MGGSGARLTGPPGPAGVIGAAGVQEVSVMRRLVQLRRINPCPA